MNSIRQLNHDENKNIGNFLRWAQERIAKEMEMIDESEIEDTSSIYSPKKKPGPKTPPTEEMMETIRSVDALRDKGMKLPEATKVVGIYPDKYAKWREKLNLSKYKKNVPTEQ